MSFSGHIRNYFVTSINPITSVLVKKYENIRGNFERDKDYLAAITNNGIWIKEKNSEKNNIIRSSYLQNANLIGTILAQSNLTDANLEGVDLSNKDLTGTILVHANLSGTNLNGVDLSNKDLTGTNLSGVNLSNTDLTGAILKDAKKN